MKLLFGFLLLLFVFLLFPNKIFAVEQDVIVSEVMYDPPGNDTDHEWVELYNSGSDPVTIIGGSSAGSWRIHDGNNRLFGTTVYQGSMTIESGSFAVIAKDPATFLSDNPGFTGNLIQASISLTNTSGVVSLRIGTSGSFWGEFSYQSTQGGNEDGNSLQKTTNGTIIAALPTPGTANASSPAPTATPTIPPSLTPTKIPTPTKVSTSTKTPTSTNSPTPTKKPTSAPAAPSKNNSNSDLKRASGVDNSILRQSSNTQETPTETPKAEVLGESTSKSPFIFIALGLIFVAACGIFAYLKFGEKIFLWKRRSL